jgi:large repetitive protein
LRISNGNGCSAESGEVTIEEPGLLEIMNVVTKDVVCFGEKGEVEVSLRGGTAPFSYHFTSSSGSVNSSAQKTLLEKGSYTLLGRDANGCEVLHQEPILVTAPAAPLSFTHTLSEFNGFNISCFGASDGIADIVASGGNGSQYSGYQYLLDNVAQDNNRIKNISAGLHTLAVKDGRGCAFGKAVTLTQPLSQLVTTLQSKTDVKCLGDADGKLSLLTTGGVEPYTYKLNQVLTQQSGSFSGLTAGSYSISISDKNGCTNVYHAVIDMLTPPMEVTLLKTDVTCHSGNDGAVQAEVSGGASPLHYVWKDESGFTVNNSNLKAGAYSLIVTDAHGCTQEKSVMVDEPEAISVKTTIIPVCVGKTNGELWLEADGGISPYHYSIDGGITFYNESKFKSVAAGSYTVNITDQNNCLQQAKAEVTVRNDQPEPNFIVATKQNALDTLIIREISVPKPDSVEWFFDSSITVVKNDSWAPEIIVNEPGNYTVAMKGFFGGCDYTHTLALTIDPYDPDRPKEPTALLKAIKEMTVSPNPNNGVFNVAVVLHTKQQLVMKVFDVLGNVYFRESWDKTTSVTKEIDLSSRSLTAGIYVIQVITNNDAREVRIAINR